MRRVLITETFDGYPDGKTRTRFAAGKEVEVEDGFAALIIAKGHAKEAAAKDAPRKTAAKDTTHEAL